MTVCDVIQRRLLRGDDAEEVLDHVEACPPCGAFADERGLLIAALEPNEDFAPVQTLVEQERSIAGWMKSRPTWMRRALAISIAGALGLIALILMRRPDFSDYPRMRMIVTLAVMAALLVASVWIGLRPLHRPSLPRWMNGSLAMVAIATAFVLAAMPSSYASPIVAEDPIHAFGMPCLYLGVMMGVPVYAIARMLDRGGNPISAVLSAVAAGLTGNLVLQIHCPMTDPLHLVFGHFAAVVAFVLASVALVWIERKIQAAREGQASSRR